MPFRLSRLDLIFLSIVAAYIMACFGITLWSGHVAHFKSVMYLGTGIQMSGFFALLYVMYRLGRAVVILVRDRPSNPTAVIWTDLRAGPLRAEVYIKALPVFIGFFFFFSSFTSMKTLISQIHPFGWDIAFMQIDRALHFGVDPWRLLQPVLGYVPVTQVLSFAYILWLPLFMVVLYWQLFQFKNESLRMQFFITFALSWAINGTFLAIVFSSAGPCFYEAVVGVDYYGPLMDYLREANESGGVYALRTQELLWENYSDRGNMLGGGIAAFPSIHCATAFLFVLLSWRAHPVVRWGFVAFFVAIFLGSVHLGWHYAVDGYFSVLVTAGIWRGVGRVVIRS